MRLLLLPILLGLAPPPSPPAGMVFIPAGRLVMGAADGEPDERPPHAVKLKAFFLDKDEVTVAAYRACVVAGKCGRPKGQTGGANLPAVWVSWRDADAYCQYAGKRLPTEAEWERAARGDDGRIYPWGNTPDCERANFGVWKGEGRCEQNPGWPEPVGRRPQGASPFGVLDMAGNVWEWVADHYDAQYYAHSPGTDPRGPKGPKGAKGAAGVKGAKAGKAAAARTPSSGAPGESTAPLHVVRGDGCCSMLGLPRASNRNAWPEDYADDDLGFRCAMDVK